MTIRRSFGTTQARTTVHYTRKGRANDYMWRPSSTSEGMRVPTMREGETMEETRKREQEEMLATLMRANSALSRIFNVEEEDDNE